MILTKKTKFKKGDIYINPKLIGAKYNRWTIVKFSHKAPYGGTKERQFWLCRCECGTEEIKFPDSIIRGRSKSCGCYNKEVKFKKRGEESILSINSKYAQYRHGATSRNLDFQLTIDEFSKLVTSNCYYCNSEPKPTNFVNKKAKTIRKWTYCLNGVDRKDNNIGYILDNCVPCCSQCNSAKMDYSFQEFKSWVTKVYNETVLNKK